MAMTYRTRKSLWRHRLATTLHHFAIQILQSSDDLITWAIRFRSYNPSENVSARLSGLNEEPSVERNYYNRAPISILHQDDIPPGDSLAVPLSNCETDRLRSSINFKYLKYIADLTVRPHSPSSLTSLPTAFQNESTWTQKRVSVECGWYLLALTLLLHLLVPLNEVEFLDLLLTPYFCIAIFVFSCPSATRYRRPLLACALHSKFPFISRDCLV